MDKISISCIQSAPLAITCCSQSSLSFCTYSQNKLQFTFSKLKTSGCRVCDTKYPSYSSLWLLGVSMDSLTSSLSYFTCSEKISRISYLGHRELLQIFWILDLLSLRPGSVSQPFSRFSLTFLMRSSKNIFMMLKSFLRLSIILALKGESRKDLNYSSVNTLQSMSFPSFSLMQEVKMIAHWYFDSTNRILSAVSRLILIDPSSKHSYSLIEMWLMNTALFLLNKKQFMIFFMAAFTFSLASCFSTMVLYISSCSSSFTCLLASSAVTSCTFCFSDSSSSTFSTTLFSLKYISLALWDPMMLFLGNWSTTFMLCLRVAAKSGFLGLNTSESWISFQEMRSFSSYSNILLMISYSYLLFRATGNLGFSFLLILATRSLKDLATMGGFPKMSSYKITPRDHTSHLMEYAIPLRICGHMYSGLPTEVLCILSSSLSSEILANPKSAILQISSLERMLAGLRSLCMMPFETRNLYPLTICLPISMTYFSDSLTFFLSLASSDSPHSSKKRQMLLVDLRTSQSLTMFSWSNFFMISISFLREISSFSGSFCNFWQAICLTATSSLLVMCAPFQTTPKEPSPSFSWRLTMQGSTYLQQELPNS